MIMSEKSQFRKQQKVMQSEVRREQSETNQKKSENSRNNPVRKRRSDNEERCGRIRREDQIQTVCRIFRRSLKKTKENRGLFDNVNFYDGRVTVVKVAFFALKPVGGAFI